MDLKDAENIRQVEAGIDWLTWVVPDAEPTGWVGRLGEQLVREQEQRGGKRRPMSFQGYHGEGSESCAFGFRSDSAYLRISGSLAASHWSALLSCSGHPTRLDVQTTWTLSSAHKRFGTLVLKRKTAAASRLHHRRPKTACAQDSAGLWIGTVGTRTSAKYIRVYDKGVEDHSAEPGEKWRIEVEAKQHLARSLWSEVSTAANPTEWCRQCVRRSIESVGGTWPIRSDESLPALPAMPPRELQTIARKRRWLESSVAPSLEQMLIALGTEEVLKILKLDGYARALTED